MNEKITFEAALQRLEKITKELESGDIALDDMVKKYEEGMQLAKFCVDKLSQAEQKIKVLTGDDNTSLNIKDGENELPEI
jgi:exodeoxyribonuclease VII small subunit